MRAVKMTIGMLSLLLFVTYFAAATPIIPQKKKTPSDETTHHVTPPSKSGKKLNFIQKIMFKKAQKKMKKAANEDKYRKWAKWSIIFGVLSAIPALGLFFMITSIVFGSRAMGRSQNERTRKMAELGILLGITLFILVTAIIASWLQSLSDLAGLWGIG